MNDTTKDKEYKLIVTIVSKGIGTGVVEAGKKAGAKGGTILLGRGTAPPSVYQNILGITFNPEKEIILILADEDTTDEILEAISDKARLNEPGKGIAFVTPLKDIAGFVQLLKQLS